MDKWGQMGDSHLYARDVARRCQRGKVAAKEAGAIGPDRPGRLPTDDACAVYADPHVHD